MAKVSSLVLFFALQIVSIFGLNLTSSAIHTAGCLYGHNMRQHTWHAENNKKETRK